MSLKAFRWFKLHQRLMINLISSFRLIGIKSFNFDLKFLQLLSWEDYLSWKKLKDFDDNTAFTFLYSVLKVFILYLQRHTSSSFNSFLLATVICMSINSFSLFNGNSRVISSTAFCPFHNYNAELGRLYHWRIVSLAVNILIGNWFASRAPKSRGWILFAFLLRLPTSQ